MPSDPRRAYLFEAKGIQRWILDGGRLRDIAAASHILASACNSSGNDLLRTALDATGFDPCVSRRAGGAFMLHFPDDPTTLDRFGQFRALWHLIFRQVAPGLEFMESQGLGPDDPAAIAAAYDPVHQVRDHAGRENAAATLPPFGHPLVAFAPRTGRPATEPGTDRMTAAKKRHAGIEDAVGEKFLGTNAGYFWPVSMDDDDDRVQDHKRFPFQHGREPWIAIMHADISALGVFYDQVRRTGIDAIESARAASEAIEAVTIEAAQVATERILIPKAKFLRGIMPARPILLGGDDITIVLRGDVALPFARVFLQMLEQVSKTKLTAFARQHLNGPSDAMGPLTAAAGLAFGKPKQPFFRLLDLAEGLCSHAKKAVKAVAAGSTPASAISFLRITESALAADADDMFDRLLLADGRRLTAQPYLAGEVPAASLIHLDLLNKLRSAMVPDLRTGRLREIRGLFQQGRNELADESWERWTDLAAKSQDAPYRTFADALAACNGSKDSALFGANRRTPLFDAMEWNAIYNDWDSGTEDTA